jgi:sugar lactone lactonase YvrE
MRIVDWQIFQPELVTAYYQNLIWINLPYGEVNMLTGAPLPFVLSAAGGSEPFVWEKKAGALPPGITLGSNGTFSGVPTTSGKYQFTLKVTNEEGFSDMRQVILRVIPNSTFGGGYNFAHFAGRMFGFLGSADYSGSFTGSGADSGGFTGSSDGSSSFTGSADWANLKPAVHAPSGVAVDAAGNIYVSDSANHQIRKITANGTIQNLAGTFTGSGGQDGTKWNARFANPQGLATDTSGNIYVADQDNHAIRKITANGTVTTVAGSFISDNSAFTGSATGFSGSADGGGKTNARFNKPADVAVDAAGNIYVADSGNHAIRKISTNGTVTTLAGTKGAAGKINALGANARFRAPQGIAVDGNGTVFVADTGNQVIRRITANGTVTTFAGAAFTGSASPLGGRASFTKSAHAAFIGSADSTNLPASVDGNATTARFSYPTDITIDSVGNLYVTDSGTEKVRRITTNGTVTTLGGSPDGFFYNPLAVAAGANGTLYIADAGNNRIARGLPGSDAIQPPVITSQPSSFENVYGNTTVTFSVSATGSGLKYQWYRNGAAVSRASTPILSLKTSTATQGVYTVVVSNTLGTVVSEPASLSLRPPADWTWGNEVPSQPALPGDTVIFSVVDVQGPGTIRYQWLKNGVAIRGKTGLSLQLDNVSIADSGVYALSITTSAGTILTESQTLHVEDTGTLVYKISANGSVATGANRTTAKLEGYLVRDRSAGDSCFVWANPAGKTLIVDSRPELIMKSTGPVVGSTSVLRSYLQELDDEESIWLSGIDNLVMVSPKTTPRGRSPSLPAQKTWVLAPQSLEGHLNTITNDGSTIIEMLRATLTLDTAQTLKAIKEDGGFDSTIDRLKTELEAKGYQQSEN